MPNHNHGTPARTLPDLPAFTLNAGGGGQFMLAKCGKAMWRAMAEAGNY